MRGLSIGDIAREAGLTVSAIRYYESSGLLPKPPRISGRRCYGREVLARLSLIRMSLDAGFTIAETRVFLTGFSAMIKPSARWRSLAERKLVEVEATIEGANRMKKLLKTRFRCDCSTIGDCERKIAAKSCS